MTTAAQAIDRMAVKAVKAAEEFRGFTQEQVDRISAAMTVAGVASERYLAEFAVEETGIGNVEDKVIKNHFGTQVVYDYMKDGKSVQGVYGKYVRHPFSGVSLAEQCGIPAEVCHIIAAHAHEGDMIKRSVEAYIVHHTDFMTFEPFKDRLKV